jgi:hypothetical protein
MSYMTNHPGSLGSVGDVVSAAKSVVEDPCLFEASKLILRLNALEQPPKRPGAPAAPPVRGIGLCSAVGPIKKVVFVKEHPWFLPLVGVAIVTGLFGLGYLTGRRRR